MLAVDVLLPLGFCSFPVPPAINGLRDCFTYTLFFHFIFCLFMHLNRELANIYSATKKSYFQKTLQLFLSI